MIITDTFEVAAPVERVWPLLCDVPSVASCIPNAEITDRVDATTYRAKIAIRLGPIAVKYGATIVVESCEDATHTITVRVAGSEARGRGGVTASVISRATSRDGRTHVDLHTDAQISGIVASLGGPLIESVARKNVAEFAANFAKLV